MSTTLEIVDIPVIAATPENTAAYGLFIGTAIPGHEPGTAPPKTKNEPEKLLERLAIPFYKGSVEEGANIPFECQGQVVIRTARIHKRPDTVTWLERHLHMTQLFIGLGSEPFAMVLGKPNHQEGNDIPDLSEVKCFVFPPGHGIMIYKGTWHDFPLAVKNPVTCLTANSPEVVEALASQKTADEMDVNDVYKIDIKKRTGKTLRAIL